MIFVTRVSLIPVVIRAVTMSQILVPQILMPPTQVLRIQILIPLFPLMEYSPVRQVIVGRQMPEGVYLPNHFLEIS